MSNPETSGLEAVVAKVLAREFPHESAARMAHVAAEVTNALTTEIAAAEQRGREDNADHSMCYVHGSKALEARLREEREAGRFEALNGWVGEFRERADVEAT